MHRGKHVFDGDAGPPKGDQWASYGYFALGLLAFVSGERFIHLLGLDVGKSIKQIEALGLMVTYPPLLITYLGGAKLLKVVHRSSPRVFRFTFHRWLGQEERTPEQMGILIQQVVNPHAMSEFEIWARGASASMLAVPVTAVVTTGFALWFCGLAVFRVFGKGRNWWPEAFHEWF